MKTVRYPNTYLVWDLETSGLVKENCKILEIGAIEVVDGSVVGRRSWILNNGIPIPEEITTLTGITQELVDTEGIEPTRAFREFLFLLDRSPNGYHLTHNGMRFDIEWLAYHVAKTLGWTVGQHKDFLEKLRWGALDTAVFVKAGKLGADRWWNESFGEYAERVMGTIAKGLKYNVGICCEELGIDKSELAQHRALGDAELTHLIYKKLLEKT